MRRQPVGISAYHDVYPFPLQTVFLLLTSTIFQEMVSGKVQVTNLISTFVVVVVVVVVVVGPGCNTHFRLFPLWHR